MELSSEISFGLRRLSNKSVVSEEHFDKILQEASTYLENPFSDEHSVGIPSTTTRIDVLKESYASLVLLMIESIRRNADKEALSAVLLEHKFSGDRIDKILRVHLRCQGIVLQSLAKFNSDPPSLVSASWKLNYCVKSSFSDFDGKCLYFIEFQVTNSNHRQGRSDPGVIKFVCTVQQLQSLVSSLRAAVRQLELIANISK